LEVIAEFQHKTHERDKAYGHQQPQYIRLPSGVGQEDDKSDPIKRNVASKYSNKGKGNLHEAGDQPVFLVRD
jgi:hypothetical protein